MPKARTEAERPRQVSQDVRDASHTYTFAANDNGRMETASLNGSAVGSYLYNAFEQRVQKTAGATTTQFVYDRAGHLLEEANGATGAAIREYIWLDDLPVGLPAYGQPPVRSFIPSGAPLAYVPLSMRCERVPSAAFQSPDPGTNPIPKHCFAYGCESPPERKQAILAGRLSGGLAAMFSLYDHVADLVRDVYDRRLDGPAVLPEHYFPERDLFTGAWQTIRDEALAVREKLPAVPRFHELMKEQASNSANDNRDWRIFVMKAYGYEVRQNISRCPVTASIVRRCPPVLSASFSFLAPGKYIPPHRGPFRGVMRFHLGLSMPPGADGLPGCVMYVNGVPYRLGNGESLLWDDTYTHELENRAEDVRVALLLDVWRPQMPADMRVLSHLIVSVAHIGASLRPNAYSG